jgi:hypothetical protein
MKNYLFKFLLLSFLYLIVSKSFTQNLTQQWNVGIYDEDFSPTHMTPDWKTYLLKTNGDTLINDLEYQKLYQSYDEQFNENYYFGALSIDSGKVIVNKFNGIQDDFLFYNYNLKVGDTATIFRSFFGDFHSILVTVDSIDNIEMDGTQLKRFFVSYSKYDQIEEDIWIEGMGSVNHGLLNESCFSATGCYKTSYLLCYYENNELVFNDASFNTCFKETIIDGVDNKTDNQYKVYPSFLDSYSVLTIESQKEMNQIAIYDIRGTIVFTRKQAEMNCNLDLNKLKNGFYVLSVNDKTFKLLINR